MNETTGDNKNSDIDGVDDTTEDEAVDTESTASNSIPDIGGDTMVDVAGQLKVEKMVAKIDSLDPDEAAHEREVRKRVEELQERKDKDLDTTFNFNMDEDL